MFLTLSHIAIDLHIVHAPATSIGNAGHYPMHPGVADAPPTPSYPFRVPKRYSFRLDLRFLRDKVTERLSLKLRIFYN